MNPSSLASFLRWAMCHQVGARKVALLHGQRLFVAPCLPRSLAWGQHPNKAGVRGRVEAKSKLLLAGKLPSQSAPSGVPHKKRPEGGMPSAMTGAARHAESGRPSLYGARCRPASSYADAAAIDKRKVSMKRALYLREITKADI